jgi:hypothetical protein
MILLIMKNCLLYQGLNCNRGITLGLALDIDSAHSSCSDLLTCFVSRFDRERFHLVGGVGCKGAHGCKASRVKNDRLAKGDASVRIIRGGISRQCCRLGRTGRRFSGG